MRLDAIAIGKDPPRQREPLTTATTIRRRPCSSGSCVRSTTRSLARAGRCYRRRRMEGLGRDFDRSVNDTRRAA